MMYGSGTCAAVGSRSAAKIATFPSDSIRTISWCIVWPPVRRTLRPGATSPSLSTKSTSPASTSGA